MKVVVFGKDGQLGRELMAAPWAKKHQLIGLSRADVDITNSAHLNAVFQTHNPNIVINAIAYNDVDAAEDDRQTAFSVNAEGVRNMAVLCDQNSATLIHVSTDYVFDGEKNTAYVETDTANPLSIYGASKLAGENAVRDVLKAHFIVRTAWLFSPHRQNFVKTIFNLLGKGKPLRVIDDQTGCPTSATDLAISIGKFVEHYANPDAYGTYHFSGSGSLNWYRFACQIAQSVAISNVEINPISTAEYGQKAKRPAVSVLNCSKFEKRFDSAPVPWLPALSSVIKQLKKDAES